MILLLGLIGTSGYIGYDKFLQDENKEQNKTANENTIEEPTTKEESLNVDSLYIKNLIERYNGGIYAYQFLYNDSKISTNNLDANFIRYTVSMNLGNVYTDTIDIEEFKDKTKELYGPNLNITDESINYPGITNPTMQVMELTEYATLEKYYRYTDVFEHAGLGIGQKVLNQKVIEATKKDNKILINVAVALTDENGVYRPTGEVIDGLTAQTFNIDNDYNKINKYQYTFIYDEDNYNYYLENITKCDKRDGKRCENMIKCYDIVYPTYRSCYICNVLLWKN